MMVFTYRFYQWFSTWGRFGSSRDSSNRCYKSKGGHILDESHFDGKEKRRSREKLTGSQENEIDIRRREITGFILIGIAYLQLFPGDPRYF